MLKTSLAFAAAAAFMACPALAQESPTSDAPAPALEAEQTAPVDLAAPETHTTPDAEMPQDGGIATRDLDDLKSGIEKGEDVPGCRSKNEQIV